MVWDMDLSLSFPKGSPWHHLFKSPSLPQRLEMTSWSCSKFPRVLRSIFELFDSLLWLFTQKYHTVLILEVLDISECLVRLVLHYRFSFWAVSWLFLNVHFSMWTVECVEFHKIDYGVSTEIILNLSFKLELTSLRWCVLLAKNGMSLHMFKSYLLSLRRVFSIFLLCFCTYLVKFIPKQLTILVIIVNGIFTTIMTTVSCFIC